MANRQQEFGQNSEELAARYLKKRGYRILERNYRTRGGEIDIIARHRRTLVFIEVKARRTLRFGGGKQAVTAAKQRRISIAALCYLKETDQVDRKARFDVVAIHRDRGTRLPPQIELVENAFELAYP